MSVSSRSSFLAAIGGAALTACAGGQGTLQYLGAPSGLRSGSVIPSDVIGRIVGHHFRGLVSSTAARGKGKGFLIGVTQGGVHSYFVFGELAYAQSGAPITTGYKDVLFFVGSNSKVFTAILLALATLNGSVALDTPVSRLVPNGIRIDESQGIIRLRHLATHSAGFPDGPCGSHFFGAYPFSHLTTFLNTYRQPYPPGAYWSYSNTGFALLGVIISNVLSGGAIGRVGASGGWPAGYRSFWQQVVAQICQPLGLGSTQVNYSALASSAVEGTVNAAGASYESAAPPQWVLGSAGLPAGAVSSTAEDMLLFLDATMGLTQNQAVKQAMVLATRPASPKNYLNMGLGWQIGGTLKGGLGRDSYYDKNGGLKGYTSYMAVDKLRQWGIVALCNTAGNDTGTAMNTKGRLALGTLRGLYAPRSNFPYPPSAPECP